MALQYRLRFSGKREKEGDTNAVIMSMMNRTLDDNWFHHKNDHSGTRYNLA